MVERCSFPAVLTLYHRCFLLACIVLMNALSQQRCDGRLLDTCVNPVRALDGKILRPSIAGPLREVYVLNHALCDFCHYTELRSDSARSVSGVTHPIHPFLMVVGGPEGGLCESCMQHHAKIRRRTKTVSLRSQFWRYLDRVCFSVCR